MQCNISPDAILHLKYRKCNDSTLILVSTHSNNANNATLEYYSKNFIKPHSRD